ncbi:hypothetical protein TNCV_2498691 [Trichonephila clavipes]|nr:hypothetical protein TNCV_2498691 [Trichonephila clavipes]
MYDIGRIGCLELLENGLVNAFEETLQLMEMNDEMKKKAEHGHDKEMPQDFRKDKDAMHVIIEMLKKAEAADRAGKGAFFFLRSCQWSDQARLKAGLVSFSTPSEKDCGLYIFSEKQRISKADCIFMQSVLLFVRTPSVPPWTLRLN